MRGFVLVGFLFVLYFVLGLIVPFLLHSTIFLGPFTFCGFSPYIPRYPAKEFLFPTAQGGMNKWTHFAINLQKDSMDETKQKHYWGCSLNCIRKTTESCSSDKKQFVQLVLPASCISHISSMKAFAFNGLSWQVFVTAVLKEWGYSE